MHVPGHYRRPRPGGGRGSELAQALDRVDRAVVKAHADILATGENVSAWKVSQLALLTLQASSWDSLGFPMQQVPSLFRLMITEGKVNSFIHCFVGVQRITSLYDLELAICESEGVQRFEELELGPLLRHPLVLHYFSVGSDVSEVFKVTTEEILSYLSILIWRKKKLTPDDLLDYIAKKKKLGKETLCLRIQSLGMHIHSMRNARRSESAAIKKCLEGLEVKAEIAHNEIYDDGDNEEYEDNMDVQSSGNIKLQCTNMEKYNGHSSDPSKAVKPRVWLDTQMDAGFSPLRGNISINDCNFPEKKTDSVSCKISSFHESPEIMRDGSSVRPGLFSLHMERGFSDKKEVDIYTRMFIKTWTDACRDKNVVEVYEEMVDYYDDYYGKKKKGKKKKKAITEHSKFSKYPFFGLLNVAVASIKFGMWDRTCEVSQDSKRQGVESTISEKYASCARVEVEAAENDALLASRDIFESRPGVSVEDILKIISAHLEVTDDFSDYENPALEKKLIFLRKLCKCECWLTERFSVDDFESLGFGEFFAFLVKYVTLLPHACQKYFLTDDTREKPSLEACMSQLHLDVFLSQASASLMDNEFLSKQKVSELLMMQYPSVCFTLLENGSGKDFLDTVRDKKTNINSSIVLFSAALTASHEKSFPDAHVTTKDALEVLLNAPMLIDLNSWSFWDLKFAPSLGPLLKWLLNEVKTKELLCLITKSGKVLRLDHSATVDSFVAVFLQGSSYQTAVKLLSLFALYGGERNVPLSLLKCHAEKALEILLKSSTNREADVGKKPFCADIQKSKIQLNKAISLVSRFTLECLGYLPEEFRSFAANLLLAGFRAIVKDAPSAILAECKHKEDRLMLHELGSSLGILEWVDDYKSPCLSLSNKASDIYVAEDASNSFPCSEDEVILPVVANLHIVTSEKDKATVNEVVVSGDSSGNDGIQHISELQREKKCTFVIESIRREEFGLDPNLSVSESSILQKQHARLGRALHCLSHELYSQDSHFLLELVQNADDNIYPRHVKPTLTFILQEGGIVVLNNELGFSTENIKALCDVGNSTKKGSRGGYIGKKGIGFKSVFRVTDAPEIHSNGFHIKFDLSEGQIGFVLPTIVPACDVDLFSSLAFVDTDPTDRHFWTTCIILPFRSKLTEASSVENIISMFSDLHPSLLLFLHRLECIRFRNMLTNSFNIMRKEIVGENIVKVSFGKEVLTWFVESRKLRADLTRHDVQTTEISIAFALEELSNGTYIPKLKQQCVFAFLPLRTYGLKFIIQGDFMLPSSREEVDGDSPWNQWLLSEFPDLFVMAERSLCSLPSFKKNLGKGVSAFMSYVPLVGEVHGFFSSIPRMIISKLCTSNCLLLEGDSYGWVPPCKVLRGWTEQVRTLLPDSLVWELLGLGYLKKDIVLSDSLAKALGIEEYGPKILLQIISSLCHTDGGIKSMGLSWLSSWLNALYEMSLLNSIQSSVDSWTESDVVNSLRKIPFIPLLDDIYGSISEGTIWLNVDTLSHVVDHEYGREAYPNLFAKLRIVNPALFDGSISTNLASILYKVGVRRLSGHEIVRVHVLPVISDEKFTRGNKDLMAEYLSFIMVHLQSSCPNCTVEREHIISEVYSKAFILTNHGYKRPAEVPIHFNKDFGNQIDVDKLIYGIDMNWPEVDIMYLKYSVDRTSSKGMLEWREFLKEVGVSDFVRAVQVEKAVEKMPHVLNDKMWDKESFPPGSTIQDWESQELLHLLSRVSSSGNRKRCKYLLMVIDTLWDAYFSDKLTVYCTINGESKSFKSSLVSILKNVRWIASSVDDELHYPEDLFHDCEAVRSILGDYAPYAVPKVQNENLPSHIGFKTCITLGDILSVVEVWRRCGTPFSASISQMSKFYTFIRNEMATSKQEIVENLCTGAFVFVPISSASTSEEVVPGVLLSPQEVYWHDDTGSVEQIKMIHPQRDLDVAQQPLSKMLSNIYPDLHDFFVNDCRVNEYPSLRGYFQILLQLSAVTTPSQAAKRVFQVFLEWADGVQSGTLNSEDVDYLKATLEKKESMVLPTSSDRWVSLHQSFGLVCWCNDEKLAEEFENLNNIDFLHLCELSDEETEMLHAKMSVLMQRLGVPSLSEVVTREAICYGPTDSSFETSLVSWALPYAQRYIYNVHPDKYLQLKLSGCEILNRLHIVVVEKLFFRNVITRSKITSKKRFECNCLMQGNILYTTPESESHTIFMELSSFLLDGIPGLHMANFLHMITTMAEAGSSEEQTENFILNNQKVPKLPKEESVWSLQATPSPVDDERKPITTRFSRMFDEQSKSNSKRKSGSNSNWPPVNWRTAPKLTSSNSNGLKLQAFSSLQREERSNADNIARQNDAGTSRMFDEESKSNPKRKAGANSNWRPVNWRTAPKLTSSNSNGLKMQAFSNLQIEERSNAENNARQNDAGRSSGSSTDWSLEENLVLSTHVESSQKSTVLEDEEANGGRNMTTSVHSENDSANTSSDDPNLSPNVTDREQLSYGTINARQASATGRRGEVVAFKHLSRKAGEKPVKWVNEVKETGLPYDILVGDEEKGEEYIEVKATDSTRKDWFEISVSEWQFAVDKGESFSIAHVVLLGKNKSRIMMYKNPVRLCRAGLLQLAVVMPK